MNSRKNNSQRKLGFQQLEDRRLMAVNVMAGALVPATVVKAPGVTAQVAAPQVAASLSKGVLTITGDAGNDAVTITQPANSPHEFILTSTNGTQFNGNYTRLDFVQVTEDVNITFKGTSESLTIGTGSQVSIPANLNVNMGNGTNSFAMYDAVVKGSMKLTGGSGHDFASIEESTIGTPTNNGGANDLTISLGGGQNGLVIENNVTVERDLNILDPSSAGDAIFMAEGITAGRYVYINTGNGADTVTLAGVTAGSQLNIQTGGGSDRVVLGSQELGVVDPVVADSIYLDLGTGDDSLRLGGDAKGNLAGGVFAKHGSTYLGGIGTDNLWNDSYQSLSGVSGFETFNKV